MHDNDEVGKTGAEEQRWLSTVHGPGGTLALSGRQHLLHNGEGSDAMR